VNAEFERKWKEKVLSQHLPGGTKEDNENPQ
jgi:hypothetical protein